MLNMHLSRENQIERSIRFSLLPNGQYDSDLGNNLYQIYQAKRHVRFIDNSYEHQTTALEINIIPRRKGLNYPFLKLKK